VRKPLTIGLTTLVLTLPAVNVYAAATAPRALKKIIVAKKTFTGSVFPADRWGNLQLTMVVKKTTTITGSKKTVKRHIESIKTPVFPDHTDRSQYISQNAIPMLIQETLKAQSAHIYIVSGATYTSDAFAQSLQSAITKEKAW
jgi:FMN-binding domain